MSTVDEISRVILILIRAGIIFRVAFLFFQTVGNPDSIEQSKSRIKNTLLVYIFAELIFVIKNLVVAYYG